VILDRDPETVKPKLLQQFTNMGQPIVELVDANHRNRSELYLRHLWEGTDLREDFARQTLRALHAIWTRPVHIETGVEGKGVLWSFDGEQETTRDLGKTLESVES